MASELTRAKKFDTARVAGEAIDSAEWDTDSDDMVTAINKKVQIKSTAPTTGDGFTWADIGTNPALVKIYDSTNTTWQPATNKMEQVTNGPVGIDLASAFTNYISGACVSTITSSTVIRVSAGSVMINGKLRRNTGNTDTNPGTDPDALDWLDVYAVADADATTFTVELVDSGTSPGSSTATGTNTRLIGSVRHQASGTYDWYINYRDDHIYGWSYSLGDGTQTFTYSVNFGVTFNEVPLVRVSSCTFDTAQPTTPTGDTATGAGVHIGARSVGTTSFTLFHANETGGVWSASNYFVNTWGAYGSYT